MRRTEFLTAKRIAEFHRWFASLHHPKYTHRAMHGQEESWDYVTECVTDFNSPLFDRSLLLLEQSISGYAQLPRVRLMKLLSGHNYRLYTLRFRDEVAGVALLYFSPGLPFVLLDYIAIHSDRRNQGLGSAFFRMLTELMPREKPSADWLIFEVDDDREGPEEKRAESRRRIEFYRRLGADLLANVPYRFPSAHGMPVPMRLMVYRLRPGAKLSPADIGAAIADTFVHVHGRTSDDDLLGWFRTHKPASLDLE
jgi:ribosomal protein S18 acetylase RimI-like enzyme